MFSNVGIATSVAMRSVWWRQSLAPHLDGHLGGRLDTDVSTPQRRTRPTPF
jgi:hypothetical protein